MKKNEIGKTGMKVSNLLWAEFFMIYVKRKE